MHFPVRLRAGGAALALLVGGLAFGCAGSAIAATSPTPLRTGKSTFWNGPTVARGDVPDAAHCDTAAGSCQTYPLELRGRGARLRVAIDTPMRDDSFEFQLIDPGGDVAASATNDNAFNAETFVADPRPGRWLIRVLPSGVTDASYRMRAKLEASLPYKPSIPAPVLPDLRAIPPIEFTFIAPANFANGLYPPDTINPPLDVGGVHPLSCTPDELAPVAVQGGAAVRCLRFTSGPMNVGAGPFEMHFSYVPDVVGGTVSPTGHGPITQTIHRLDGTSYSRPAGTYSFHALHGHFHDDNILHYELFTVEGKRLVPAGVGTKSGFCPANQLFGEWRKFVQDPPDEVIGSGDTGAGNCQSPADGVLGLSPGWGDVYRWQRPGQYVEFAGNGDGTYVVRATVDARNDVLELKETNNSAYTLIRVVGEDIDIVERGQGTSPFDRKKVVFRGAGPASRD